MPSRALITGITGQDGSYLAEHLLDRGYEVIGMLRRSSTLNFERIAHIQDRLTLVPGDLLDEVSMINVLREHRPTEVYNLAAQSFVQTSWVQPVLTGETTALGVTRMLDAIRIVDPEIRFYQASSSEMFGKVLEVPQRETTPFYPRSPYGVAKVYGHWITVNYAESYGLHASSGILFNHESVPFETPVVVRRHGLIDVVAIGELLGVGAGDAATGRVQRDGDGLEVWDGEGWSRCWLRSGWRYEAESIVVHGHGGIVQSTPDHVVFTPDGEQPACRFAEGDDVRLAEQPGHTFEITLTTDEAWLLGALAAGGSVGDDGAGTIGCADESVLAEAAACWTRVTGGMVTKCSGTGDGGRAEPLIELLGARHYLRMVRTELSGCDGPRRVPKRILNAAPHLQEAFLGAYRLVDRIGAGHRTGAFGATSPVLAAGLVWMARRTLGQTVFVEVRSGQNGERYLVSSRPAGREGFRPPVPPERVRRVEARPYRGWMCDLATESGKFAAGVGFVVVHNSPRRGLDFAPRKISHGVARIKLGLESTLAMGNLDAQRDWGYAADYVRAMWLMLQQDEPTSYVVATGTTHSVREFCELAFGRVGLDYRDHVTQDERFMRPAEVDLLVGDPTRAREVLGWKPEVDFSGLVHMMVDADMELVARQNRERG